MSKINCFKCSYCLPDNKGWVCFKSNYRRVGKYYVKTKTRPSWCKRRKKEE